MDLITTLDQLNATPAGFIGIEPDGTAIQRAVNGPGAVWRRAGEGRNLFAEKITLPVTPLTPATAEPDETDAGPYVRNVITVEILSGQDWTPDELQDLYIVADEITKGASSGQVTVTVANQKVSAQTMADLLIAQGSEPTFLIPAED